MITIRRNTPIDQEVVLDDYAPFPADAVEEELEKLTKISQDLGAAEPILAGSAARARDEADRAEQEADRATDEANKSAASAAEAAISETNAATSAQQADGFATDAAQSAFEADQSAGDAATSATEAATSETNAATSATEAATSATEADNTLKEFQDEYWGEIYWDTSDETTKPTVNPVTGTPPDLGDLFFNTYDNTMYVMAVLSPYTWIDTGATGVTQMLPGQNVILEPQSGKGIVKVTATATGDVDEVVIGRFEGKLTYNEPVPTQNSDGTEIIYRNGDYFIFVGPDGTRTVPPVGEVRTGDYCICTTGTKGPQDDYTILEEQIQKNAEEISFNDTDIAELEGSTNVGSTVILVDGGRY